jgi:hypothetical protein
MQFILFYVTIILGCAGNAAMTVRRDQLIIDVIGHGKILQCGRCLVVDSLKSGFESFDSEFLMDGVI